MPAGPPASAAPTLLLFPTAMERDAVAAPALDPEHLIVELCGFGPIAAAAHCAQLVGRLHPRRVILAGIAGAFDERGLPVGSALEFSRVAVDGVGVGEGARRRSAAALGFAQWRGARGVEDELELEPLGVQRGELLLTACSASASDEQARERVARFPDAVAEDMEGFGVALACALYDTPLSILRGISNRVGERDRGKWHVPEALDALRELLLPSLRPEEA
jgi:futalosine hydrolase